MPSVSRSLSKRLRQRVQRTAALQVTHLPGPVVSALGRRKRVTVDGRTLDPQLAAILQLDEIRGTVDISRFPPAIARKKIVRAFALLDMPRAGGVDVRETQVAGATGPLPARWYAPFSFRAPSPLVVFFHGGGMVTCGLDTHDAFCRRFVLKSGLPLISVDYRLAPEHRFPAAPDDSVAAFKDIAARASQYGALPNRLAVMGDSAGGNMSALVSNRLRGEPVQPALQVLIYPATDLTGTFPSHRTFAEGFFLTKPVMDWFMDHYFAPGSDRRVPEASPHFAPDLTGVAPAIIYTAGFDPLRDEGEAYAEKLVAAGVPVTYREFGSLVHGFIQMGGAVDAARNGIDLMAADVWKALAG